MELLQAITLDFAQSTMPVTVFAKQYDKDTRKIEITPINNGAAYTLESGTTARLQMTKPDGTTVINNATIGSGANAGKITVTLTAQCLTAAGTAVAEIGLYKNSALLSSQIFYIDIQKGAYDEDAPESSSEYNALVEALTAAEQATTAATSAASRAETAVTNANNAASRAEAAVTTANAANARAETAYDNATAAASACSTAASSANTQASNAAQAATNAGQAAEAAYTNAQAANDAASDATTAANNAITATTAANNAATAATTAASSANTQAGNAATAATNANNSASRAEAAVATANAALAEAQRITGDLQAALEEVRDGHSG